MSRPLFNFTCKEKAGSTVQLGAVWPAPFEGAFNFRPRPGCKVSITLTDEEGKTRTFDVSKGGNAYATLYANSPRDEEDEDL